MSNEDITIKLPIEQISILGKDMQGLRLINLRNNQYTATTSILEKE